jgi:hypothetical protein
MNNNMSLTSEDLLNMPLREVIKNNLVIQAFAAKDAKVEAIRNANKEYMEALEKEGKSFKSIALHGTTSKVR